MYLWYLLPLIFYLTPLLRLLCRPKSLWTGRSLSKLNLFFGIFEYYIGAPRYYVLGLTWIVVFVVHLTLLLIHEVPLTLWGILLIPSGFLSLNVYASHHQVLTRIRLAEFLRMNPAMHPQSFFNAFYQMLGPFLYQLPDPKTQSTIQPESASFKKMERSRQKKSTLIPVLWDTTQLAHTSLKTLKYVGKEYARESFDLLASMWGKRFLQLTQSSLQVTGAEKIKNLKGKIILVLNHKSQLDFVLTFFALSQIVRPQGRGLRPRFITAKDHFLDNRLVYDVIGVGRLVETVDMVFIERKKAGRAFENLKQAAHFLANKEIEVAIFPQGTRAEGNVDRSDKRRDAGYYTPIPPKDIHSDLGHLRKGTAYLATDTLIELASQKEPQDLHLVFIGLSGTATILPKKSLTAQTETDIRFDIGEPLTLMPEQAKYLKKPLEGEGTTPEEKNYLDFVENLHQEIDKRLVACLKIHENLKFRFLLDLKGYFRLTPDRIRLVEHGFEGFSDSLPYQILDRIYACPSKEWNPYLSELAQLLMDQSSRERLKVLREQVTIKMLESLKHKKIHGKKIKKKEIQEGEPEKKVVNLK